VVPRRRGMNRRACDGGATARRGGGESSTGSVVVDSVDGG
jgi:hypothetical protein